MKLQYKILALTLTFVMVLGLAACGGGAADAVATPPPATDAPAVGDTPTDTPAAADDEPNVEDLLAASPVKDLGGRNMRWLSWWDLNQWPVDGLEPNPEEDDNYLMSMMRWDHTQKVYKDYNFTTTNVTIDFGEMSEVLATSVMSGDPAGDLVLLDAGMALNAITGNLLIPFEDFIPADHDIFTTQDYAHPTAELIGKTWTVDVRAVPTDGGFLGVNMDIIRAIGAENPGELYDRGEWTFDKFLEIARLATRSTTGDGVIDQYGIGGQANDIMSGLIAGNDGVQVTEDLKYGYDDPKTMRAMEAAYQIFNVDKSWNFDPSSGASFDDWNRNTYAFLEGRTCMFVAWIWSLPDLADRTFEYIAVPFPKGPDNTGDVSYFSAFMSGIGIPRGVQNPEDVFTTWYELNRWFGNDFELKDEQDLNWPYSKFNSEEAGARIMGALEKGRKIDISNAVFVDGRGYSWITGGFCQAFYNDTATPAQIVEENRQSQQDMLDTVFGSLATQ